MLLIQLHSNLQIGPYLKTYDTLRLYSLNKHNKPIDNAYSATRHQTIHVFGDLTFMLLIKLHSNLQIGPYLKTYDT